MLHPIVISRKKMPEYMSFINKMNELDTVEKLQEYGDMNPIYSNYSRIWNIIWNFSKTVYGAWVMTIMLPLIKWTNKSYVYESAADEPKVKVVHTHTKNLSKWHLKLNEDIWLDWNLLCTSFVCGAWIILTMRHVKKSETISKKNKMMWCNRWQ